MFVLSPWDVGIILTYRCHSGCRHCIYGCDPRRSKDAMAPEMLRSALEAISTCSIWTQPPQVHLTGGEPFLHFDLLLEGARIAKGLGIAAYVETSGAWCADESEAVERFAALRDAGLQAVLVSCSPFHAEHIPLARTLRAIRAAWEVFGPRRVTVYLPDFLDIVQRIGDALERPTPLARYEELFGLEEARRILWDGYGLISGGRAGYALGHLTSKHPPQVFGRMNCAAELLYAQHSHFDLYGHFIPAFCGGLAIGDWRDLEEIVDRFQAEGYPPLVRTLIERGPYGLCQVAEAQYGYRPLEAGYVGKCHLCVDVRRHLVETGETGDFAELRPREFYHHLEEV
jgi:hypothetical protein